jgi:hypothetical protein
MRGWCKMENVVENSTAYSIVGICKMEFVRLELCV